jgi:tetratricopeptide (TPR) repeat protein
MAEMQAAENLKTGRVIGRFVVEGVLGVGGMATVYRAWDAALGCAVALKRLNSGSAHAVALFEQEFQTLAGLRHPCIIKVLDYGVDADGPYYTMELLEGGDVSTVAPLPWRKVCECLRDVGSALTLVHGRQMVHRDISPRNVWQMSGGGFKVIDFGAMARFGITKDIVGTPSCLAPESVDGSPIDQRADLYSLGSVAYFLLTARPAYAARTVADVASPRQQKPAAPSVCVKGAGEDIPAELDDLILSLLSRTPLARPFSAAEVIERACAIAGLTEAHPQAARSHLISTEFVGRDREKRLLRNSIARLHDGAGSASIVDAPPGLGKTRLLMEAHLIARVAGITALHAEARLCPEFHGVALKLAMDLVELVPALAREMAAPHIGTLGHLSTELRDRLDPNVSLAVMPATPGEARMRVQDALLEWFLAVAKRQKIAVFVDDIHELDQGSAAFLAALARKSERGQLLVIATASQEEARVLDDAVKALRAAAKTIRLPAFALDDTRALLRSAFGDVPHLPRLAEKLHERSGGNPQHCTELVEQLVLQDAVHYQGGVWILPQEIRDEQLPGTWEAVIVGRCERLSQTARTLAKVLHLHGGLVTAEGCQALLDDEPPDRVSTALDELLREGFVTGSRSGCRFVARYGPHLGALEPERARGVRRKVAESILNQPNPSALDKLAAGLHLLQAGDDERAGELLARGGIDIAIGGTGSKDDLPAAIPKLEAAVRIYRERNRPPEELVSLLAPLASGAYYADRRLAALYGDEALDILQSLLGLKLAARLRPFLGRKISLIIGLIGAAIRFKRLEKTHRAPTLREAFTLLFTTVATLTGVYVICIDPTTALRYARALEPLTALGENHIASFMYRFSRSLVMTVQDQGGKARAAWYELLNRLRDGKPIRDLPEDTRSLYLGGALYACGVIESWTDGPGALRIAEELDAMGMKLYQMSADQVRAMYYANQGNNELFHYYRNRVETHAIQRGTAWQVEIWALGAVISVHLRNHDAMGMKLTRDVLERLATEIPSLKLYACRARGAYWVMRGRHAEAIEVLDAANQGDFKSVVGATRSVGVLARAHNLSGNPSRAKELCLEALAALGSGDSDLVVMNQIVPTELALSEARLGNFEAAERTLDTLIEKHLPLEGPLTLGMFYEARARVAQLRGEREAARGYLSQMDEWYQRARLPSLAAHSELLWAELEERTAASSVPADFDLETEDTSDTLMVTND